jgi:hypothetical protein
MFIGAVHKSNINIERVWFQNAKSSKSKIIELTTLHSVIWYQEDLCVLKFVFFTTGERGSPPQHTWVRVACTVYGGF